MTDLDIANAAQPLHINDIAEKLHIKTEDLEHYGKYKAKLPLSLIDDKKAQKSKLILVSAISPTPAGEGKTTISIGLNEGFRKLNKSSIVVLREPSLGPVFGLKGGATGGGKSQVLPMEDINLYFTGDFSAIEKANNLLAAMIDNNIQSKTNNLNIDARTVKWKRVLDVNDRALRQIIVGLGGTTMSVPRETGFDITAASEIMAILCLTDNLSDLKARLGRIFIGFTHDKTPIYAKDLKANGAMAALLKDAVKPNLVQTIEGNPAIIHGGPFANIAQGTNSVIATKMGMSLADYTITEAGFGFDLGGEKFLNIKCQSAGLKPEVIVLTATIRALKYHGGKSLEELNIPDTDAVKKGLPNLEKHIENAQKFNIKPIIAINQFTADTDEEIQVIRDFAQQSGIKVAIANVWAKGGNGALELAQDVIETLETTSKDDFSALYKWEQPIEDKIETIAKTIYGASAVEYTAKAKVDLKRIQKLGLNHLPICMAKTQKSLSDDAALRGKPENFSLSIREIEIASGAGFIIPISGNMMRMPGLSAHPAAEQIDIDDKGHITGLF
ncbi:formate--tetrahydrofolate ligase [Mesohalobacter halotolerans]|uniref:Formate--tetrahydrofolate ligase n=1 Tax=Mesohalobacter halotolerans TaxID=1883405 RepID=A0A4U5TSG9_9FLAO|nr:formate--tetrahydrofolate ligase [Mesohalobacter halotolerans]MBS3737461.1 formate--tetrahydrofolate ligase [Psychroflexus sp.]TKS57043.1 formate--tetrahydrofolate ligase [Mesohalobacter halotolerans]